MTLRLTDRVDLDVYYDIDSARHDAGVKAVVTRSAFRAFYGGCPSVGFEADGVPIGGVIFDGRVPHIAVHPAWHGLWGTLLRPMLRWLYGLNPDMVVRVDDDNPQIRAFVRHCGWPAVGRSGSATLHRMTPLAGRRAVRLAPHE